PLLLRELAHVRGPVHRALVAQPLERLVGRAFEPQLPFGDENLVDVDVLGVAADRGHCPPSEVAPAVRAILLAGWAPRDRVTDVTHMSRRRTSSTLTYCDQRA